ncbi:MAG: hypothetical protein H0W73_13600 [Bacteroidetes bacterium]|nr:hypothetical protein [Bacteroidota bacterium]
MKIYFRVCSFIPALKVMTTTNKKVNRSAKPTMGTPFVKAMKMHGIRAITLNGVR